MGADGQSPGMAVDTTEWGITVPTVERVLRSLKNEMVFPAGALVPRPSIPLPNLGANYGSLGGSWAAMS
jgi:putative endopeptidase